MPVGNLRSNDAEETSFPKGGKGSAIDSSISKVKKAPGNVVRILFALGEWFRWDVTLMKHVPERLAAIDS